MEGDESKRSDGHSSQPEVESSESSATLVSPRSGSTIKRSRTANASSFSMPGITDEASPPTFVMMSQLAEAAKAFCDMSLAHEITVDSEFRLENRDPPQQSLEHRVKETMHRAFWDILRSSLEADPPDYEPALRLLVEVKESLNELVLPNQKTLRRLIDNSLDMDVPRAQLRETGKLSLASYAEQVIGVIKQFCAPIRDQEVESLRTIEDPVEAFKSVFALLDKMHLDLANFTIAQMRPFIRQHAVNYERDRFAEFLEVQQKVGVDGLARTRDWIKQAYERLVKLNETSDFETTEAQTVNHDPSSSTSAPHVAHCDKSHQTGTSHIATPNAYSPNNILREAYLMLLSWPHSKDWPETVVMDQQRFTDLGSNLSKIVTLTSLVLVICNYVATNLAALFTDPTPVRLHSDWMLQLKHIVCRSALTILDNSDCAQIADILPEQVCVAVERWRASVLDSSAQSSTRTASNLPDGTRQDVAEYTTEVLNGRHPVHVLMHNRAINFLRLALASGGSQPLSLPPGFSILLDMDKSLPNLPDSTISSSGSLPPMASGGLHPTSSRPAHNTMVINYEAETPKKITPMENLSLSYLTGRLLPLLTHNRHVFGPRYAELIQAVLPDCPPITSSAAQNHASPQSQTNCEHQTVDHTDSQDNETTFEMHD